MSIRTQPIKRFDGPVKNQGSLNASSQTKTKNAAKNNDALFRLMDLPTELRRRILEFSCLVVRPLPNLSDDSLSFYEGECSLRSDSGTCCGRCKGQCQCPSQHCACYLFSTALFYTCRTLSMEAREVCFSVNRFVLLDIQSVEKFLKKQPPHLLQLIRELEYVFGAFELLDGFRNDTMDTDMRQEWPDFIEFVKKNLHVKNLTFSVDASRPYGDWVTTGSTQADIEGLGLPEIFNKIVTPLKEVSDLKHLYLYWPCFHALETEGEKLVKGSDYDAYVHGKVALKDRAPGYPRGGQSEDISVGLLGSYDAAS